MNHEKFMLEAIKEAKKAQAINEVPIGAVIVRDNRIIARAHNLRETKQIATAHAEILAIQKACKKEKSWRLEGCTLYVTLEPCPMCAGAIILSRIENLVFGSEDPKGGSVVSTIKMYEQTGYNHYPSVSSGVMNDECSSLLKEFFKNKRKNKSEVKQQL